MKNKRFLLIGAIVLIASLLIAGLAMADAIKGVTFAPATLSKDLENGTWHGYQFDATGDIVPTLDPAAPDPFYVEWSVSDSNVVYLSNSYTYNSFSNWIYSQKPGKATITMKVYNDADGKYLFQKTYDVEFKEVAITNFTQTATKVELGKDESQYLTVYLSGMTPANATYNETNGLNWTSSDMTIVKVDSDGEVHAKKAGTATITASLKSDATKKWTFDVTVTEKVLTGITLSQSDIKLEVDGEDVYLYATKEPVDATDTLKWTISDSTVAYLNNTTGNYNYVYPLKAGTATITVASKNNPSIKAECTVTVVENKITGLAFSQKEFKRTLNDGNFSLSSYLDKTPADGIGEISWTSSDITVATVNDGWVSVQKPGTVTITAAYAKDPTIKAEATITIEAINATAVAFNQTALELEQGEIYGLGDMIQLTPADATLKELTFSSSDRDAVELSGDFGAGYYMETTKVGTSTITVTAKNFDDSIVTGTMTVTVKAPPIESFGFAKTEYALTTTSKNLDLWRRLVIKPDNRKWLMVFPDDPDYLIWDSSDATIASVDAYGEVTPVSVGTATISVTYAYDTAVTASVTVNVTGTPVKKIALNRTKIEFSPYDTERSGEIKLSYQPSNADIKEIYWTTSDPTIAWISSGEPVANSTSSGVFDTKYLWISYGDKTGTATITVRVDDGATVHEATCEVTVKYPKAKVALANKKVTLSVVKDKGVDGINNLYYFEDWNKLLNNDPDSNKEYYPNNFSWKSSAKKVASVDKYGNITALKKGKAVITGTLKKDKSVTVKCTVTITQTKIKSISAVDRTIRVGEVYNLLGGSYNDAWIVLKPKTTARVRLFNPELTITSSNTKVVSVKNYKLTALKPGTVKITVKATDGSKKKTTFTVNVVRDIEHDE